MKVEGVLNTTRPSTEVTPSHVYIERAMPSEIGREEWRHLGTTRPSTAVTPVTSILNEPCEV